MTLGTPGGRVYRPDGVGLLGPAGQRMLYVPGGGACCGAPCEYCQGGVAPPRWLATFSGIQVCDSCVPYYWGDDCDSGDNTGRTFAWSILSGMVNGSFLLTPVPVELPSSCDWHGTFPLEARCDRWNREYVYYGPDCAGQVCTDIYRSDTYSGCYIRLSVFSVLVAVQMGISGDLHDPGELLFSSEDWLSSPLDCTQPYTVANYFQECLCPSGDGRNCVGPGSGGSVTLTPYYG